MGTGEIAVAGQRDPRDEAGNFADVVREVLLLPFTPPDRARHLVPATRMALAAAPVILGALDAARASAGRGEPRANVVSAYVRALSRATSDERPTPDPASASPLAELREDELGPDALLLAHAAAEYTVRADEASGIDAEEADRCRRLAEGLRVLSSRHQVWFAGRDASPPWQQPGTRGGVQPT